MLRHLLSGICVVLLVPTVAFAYGSTDAHFGVTAEYQNNRIDMAGYNSNDPTAPNGQNTLGGQVTGQKAMLSFNFSSPSGAIVQVSGGMAFNSSFNGSVSQNQGGPQQVNMNEIFNFGSSPVFGGMVGYDLFADSRFHLIPNLRWLHTAYTGTTGTLNGTDKNGASCSMDFSDAANSATHCQTLSNFPLNDGTSIKSTFSETLMRAQIAAAVDVFGGNSGDYSGGAGGGLTLKGGVEEVVSVLTGDVSYSTANSAGYADETYSFASNKNFGYFGGLTIKIASFDIWAEYHNTNEAIWTGGLTVNF